MRQIPKRVMIVSFDAVGAKDLEYLQTLPNFQRFFEQAALCSHVNSVCPSLTYPAHTSIVTGRMPKNHGIVNNTKIQPGRKDPDWLYHRKWIRSTTLYDEAKKKGMTTAGLLWPVAAGSRMDYYVPEIMVTRKWQNRSVVLSAGSEQTLRTFTKRNRTAPTGQFHSGMRAGYDLQIQSAAVFAASDGCGYEQTSLWRGE